MRGEDEGEGEGGGGEEGEVEEAGEMGCSKERRKGGIQVGLLLVLTAPLLLLLLMGVV